MLRFIRTNGFELEKIYPGFFVLQSLIAGFITGALLFLYIAFQVDLRVGPPRSFLEICVIFVFCASLGIIPGAVLGTTIRFLSWLCNLSMKVLTRLVLVMGLNIGFCLLFAHISYNLYFWPNRYRYFFVALLAALPTALLVGSNAFRATFSFGTVRSGKSRVTSESKLALVAMVPLRILCVVGLAIWCAVLPHYWHYFVEVRQFLHFDNVAEIYVGITCFLGIYLLLALYLSYRSPRPVILISLSFLLNIPLTAMAVFAYMSQQTVFEGLTKPFAITCLSLAFSFAVCVAVRAAVSIVDEPIVEGGREQKVIYETTCLGTAYQSWQALHEEVMHGGTT